MEDNLKKYIEMKASGLSDRKISKELSIDRRKLSKWRKDFAESISNTQASMYQEVLNEHHLYIVNQIQFTGNLIGRLISELESRDITDLDTKDLISAIFSLYKFTNDQTKDIQFKDGWKQFPLQLR